MFKIRKEQILGITLISVLIVGSIFAIFLLNKNKINDFFNPSSKSPGLAPADILKKCNILYENGNDKINLVFFSNNEQAKKYSDYLFSVPPFNKHKEEFNVYYIDSYQPPCEIYKGVAMLCDRKETLEKATSCPNDFIIVLKEYPEEIRSSSYMNVLSLNSAHPLSVIVHEFAHTFANLADEYVPATIPKGSKNCVSSCSQFESETDGCFEGCSKDDYFRSIEDGIMRTLNADTYGKFNEDIIEKKIITDSATTLTGRIIDTSKTPSTTECASKKYSLFEGTPEEITKHETKTGCPPSQIGGNSAFKITDIDENTLAQGTFNPYDIFTDGLTAEKTTTGEVIPSDKNFILITKIQPQAKYLIIDENIKLLIPDIENNKDSTLIASGSRQIG